MFLAQTSPLSTIQKVSTREALPRLYDFISVPVSTIPGGVGIEYLVVESGTAVFNHHGSARLAFVFILFTYSSQS